MTTKLTQEQLVAKIEAARDGKDRLVLLWEYKDVSDKAHVANLRLLISVLADNKDYWDWQPHVTETHAAIRFEPSNHAERPLRPLAKKRLSMGGQDKATIVDWWLDGLEKKGIETKVPESYDPNRIQRPDIFGEEQEQ